MRQNQRNFSVFLEFRRGVNEICSLLGFYAAQNGRSLPTFRDSVSVPFSRYRQLAPKRRYENNKYTLREVPGMAEIRTKDIMSHVIRLLGFWLYEAEVFGAVEWIQKQTFRGPCIVIYRVFQKDLNIFYSGHRGHRT